ncbi:hypothetical protein [Prosthecobacter sp.]|uniref:hypothetical protein n=1 Tax=Prosthecobacter sp. TaxID=1965333 RepID=UPI003783CE0A
MNQSDQSYVLTIKNTGKEVGRYDSYFARIGDKYEMPAGIRVQFRDAHNQKKACDDFLPLLAVSELGFLPSDSMNYLSPGEMRSWKYDLVLLLDQVYADGGGGKGHLECRLIAPIFLDKNHKQVIEGKSDWFRLKEMCHS